jgi:hypothetical protein
MVNRVLIRYLITPVFVCQMHIRSVGLLSRYSDWLRDGRSGDRVRWRRDFLHLSRPALGTTQTPIKWVPSLSEGSKIPSRNADPLPPSSA